MAKVRKPGRGHDAKGRSRRGSGFIQIRHNLLESEAWASLTPAQRCVYLVLEQTFNGSNNGEIGLSVRRAGEMANVHKDTAAEAFKVLEERGFIKKATPGGFSRKIRHATEWTLTVHSLDDRPPTRDFATWRENHGPSKPDGVCGMKGPSVRIGGTVGN